MKKVILKYLLTSNEVTLILPLNATPIAAQNQFGNLHIWIEQDEVTDTEYQERFMFLTKVTGQSFDIDKDLKYLNTVQLVSGTEVIHIYWKSLGTQRMR